jgi:hypothetical protein
MRYRTLAAVSSVALVLSIYLIAARGPVSGLPDLPEPSDSPVAQNPGNITEAASLPDASAAEIQRAAIEVRGMSSPFRNSTFLIAIRRAGYYCDDIVSASESVHGGWVASCADKGGYTLSVRAIDEFDVRPIGHYWDGVGIAPVLIPRDPEQR